MDILVNNAGISAREPLADYKPESFKAIMDLNVTGTVVSVDGAAQTWAHQTHPGRNPPAGIFLRIRFYFCRRMRYTGKQKGRIA